MAEYLDMADHDVLRALQTLNRHGMLDEIYDGWSYTQSDYIYKKRVIIFLPDIQRLEVPREAGNLKINLYSIGTFHRLRFDAQDEFDEFITRWKRIRIFYANR